MILIYAKISYYLCNVNKKKTKKKKKGISLENLQVYILFNSLEVPLECSVELSPLGYQFFTELFQIFDKDKDGALNRLELDSLFSTSPGNPWANTGFPHTTITTETGSVTLQGWLAQWR